MKSNLYQLIEDRFDELEVLLIAGSHSEATHFIPLLSKFIPVLTEEQRDFLNAAKIAIEEKLEWK